MILTCKRLLVDIFFIHILSKSLAFCEFTSVNFVPWRGPQDSYIKTVEILKLLFQVLLFIRTFQYHQRRATDWKQHRKLILCSEITHRWESPDMFEMMQRKKICLAGETSTMKPLKILRFVGHFQEEVACESCSKHSAFTENFIKKLVITFKRSWLNRDFFTLGFD